MCNNFETFFLQLIFLEKLSKKLLLEEKSFKMKLSYAITPIALAMITFTLTACNSQSAGDTASSGITPVSAGITAGSSSSGSASSASPTATPVGTSSYPSCVSSDPTHTCIGLKIVSYENSDGVTDMTEAQAVTLVNGINAIYSQCNIAFQLEVYQSVNPTTLGLPYSPNWETQTDAVRTAFADKTRFVIEAVGPWTTATIAVTTMPGSGLYGSVVEQQYAKNPITVTHELSHYEGLYDESSDSNNLESLYYSPEATQLTAAQCATSESINKQYWSKMLRTP
jgi:hypothetical protein